MPLPLKDCLPFRSAFALLKRRWWWVGALLLELPGLSAVPSELAAPQPATFRVSLTLEAEYDDNAFATAEARGDEVIYRARPQIGYSRVGPRFDLRSTVGATYSTFQNDSNEDTLGWNLLLGIATPQARKAPLSWNLEARYEETEGADRLLGVRLQRSNYGMSGSLGLPTGPSSSLALEANWNRSGFSTANSATTEDYSLAARWFYDYSARLGTGVGYRFQIAETSTPQPDQGATFRRTKGHALFATARTVLSPRVRGSMDLGAQWTESDEGSGEVSPYITLNLAWQATSKVNLGVSVRHDFNSATDANARVGGALDFGWSPTERTSLIWSIGAASSVGADGQNRNRYETGLRFNHAVTRFWDYGLGVSIGQDRIGGSAGGARAETYTFSANLNIRPLRRITVSSGVEYDVQASASENLDFTRFRARTAFVFNF